MAYNSVTQLLTDTYKERQCECSIGKGDRPQNVRRISHTIVFSKRKSIARYLEWLLAFIDYRTAMHYDRRFKIYFDMPNFTGIHNYYTWLININLYTVNHPKTHIKSNNKAQL